MPVLLILSNRCLLILISESLIFVQLNLFSHEYLYLVAYNRQQLTFIIEKNEQFIIHRYF